MVLGRDPQAGWFGYKVEADATSLSCALVPALYSVDPRCREVYVYDLVLVDYHN